jgi:hypothetical protein
MKVVAIVILVGALFIAWLNGHTSQRENDEEETR